MHFFILSIKCPRENRKVFMFFSLFCPEFFFSESWLKNFQPTIWSQHHHWWIQSICIPKLYYHDAFYKALAHNLFINKTSKIVSYFWPICRDLTLKEQGEKTEGSKLLVRQEKVDVNFDMNWLDSRGQSLRKSGK